MELVEAVIVEADRMRVWKLVSDLGSYSQWMRFVYAAAPLNGVDGRSGSTAWDVELRARVGPFTRSKRLRMVRTSVEPLAHVRFERAELDGKQHANWILDVELSGLTMEQAKTERTEVTMYLSYDGQLWTGGLLENILQDEIGKGRRGLQTLLTSGTAQK